MEVDSTVPPAPAPAQVPSAREAMEGVEGVEGDEMSDELKAALAMSMEVEEAGQGKGRVVQTCIALEAHLVVLWNAPETRKRKSRVLTPYMR